VAAAKRPVNAGWLIALVGITILSDWTENVTQLQQLRQFISDRQLDAGWIGCRERGNDGEADVFHDCVPPRSWFWPSSPGTACS
jgi:hypothetical protein